MAERWSNQREDGDLLKSPSSPVNASSNNGLLFITSNNPADFKLKKVMTRVRKKAMGSYLEAVKPNSHGRRSRLRSEDSTESRTSVGSDQNETGLISNEDALKILRWSRRNRDQPLSPLHRSSHLSSTVGSTSVNSEHISGFDKQTLSQGMHIAQNSTGRVDQRKTQYLERKLSEVWAKLQVRPKTYNFTRDEFALCSYYSARFGDSKILRDAKNRYLDNHPDALTCMANLAMMYRKQGQWKEAERLFVEVIETSKNKLEPDHPLTLSSMAHLAATYREQGQWEDAERLDIEVIETSKNKLGLDHPDTLTCMANLAATYRKQGRWKEAERLDVEVIETSKDKLGLGHHITLSSMANLATTYWNQGRWEEAGGLDVEVIKTSKNKLGLDHPLTMSSMTNLATMYRNQGRWKEAERLFVEVMETSKNKFGLGHPDTLTCMANLVVMYRKQGRREEAERLEVIGIEASKNKLELNLNRESNDSGDYSSRDSSTAARDVHVRQMHKNENGNGLIRRSVYQDSQSVPAGEVLSIPPVDTTLAGVGGLPPMENHSTTNTKGIADNKIGVSNGEQEQENHSLELDLDAVDKMESLLHETLVGMKNLSLWGLMDHAHAQAQHAAGNLSSGQSTKQAGSKSPDSSSSQPSELPRRLKRSRDGGRDPGDRGDDSDDNDDDHPRKRNERSGPNKGLNRRLKCPFYQREPEKYSKASCRGEGFADMAKLKDHIKRVHTQPLRCPRCWKEMDTQNACDDHLQQEQICGKRPEPLDDRIRQQTLRDLDFKKAPYANARNAEEKWKLLYRELFPQDRHVPSPFDQPGIDPRLERLLYEALEEELDKELEPALGPILCRIKSRIPSIIRNCKMRLVQMSPLSDVIYTPSSGQSMISSSDSEGRSQRAEEATQIISCCSGSVSANDEGRLNPKPSDRVQESHSSTSEQSQCDPASDSRCSSTDSFIDMQMVGVDEACGSEQEQEYTYSSLHYMQNHSPPPTIPGRYSGSTVETEETRCLSPSKAPWICTKTNGKQPQREDLVDSDFGFSHDENGPSNADPIPEPGPENETSVNFYDTHIFQPLPEWACEPSHFDIQEFLEVEG